MRPTDGTRRRDQAEVLKTQGKLLRAIQEGQFERVGGERTRRVDVRIIAATDRNLPDEIVQGRFRQDLYYRLSVFPIDLPALRERLEDIPEFAAYFVGPSATRNIRELQNVVERAVSVPTVDPSPYSGTLRW